MEELARLCVPYLIETKLITQKHPPETCDGGRGENMKAQKHFIITETGEEIDKGGLENIVALEQERMKRLDEIPQLTELFFKESLDYEAGDLVWKGKKTIKQKNNKTKKNLESLLIFLQELSEKEFTEKKLEDKIKKWIGDNGLNTGEVLWPMRVALSGLRASPSPFELAGALGKDKTLKRIKVAMNKL